MFDHYRLPVLVAAGAIVIVGVALALRGPGVRRRRMVYVLGRRVYVSAPDRPKKVLVYLHGHGASAAAVEASLVRVFDGTDVALIVPELGARSEPGPFGESGALLRLLDATVPRHRRLERLIFAHSGGYVAAVPMLDMGGIGVSGVALLDALYAGEGTFERFVLRGGKLLVVYGPSTREQSLALGYRMRARLGAVAVVAETVLPDATLSFSRGWRMVVMPTVVGHAEVPVRYAGLAARVL